MSIAVVTNTASTPPRFEITITTPDGSVMTAVTLTRTAQGSTQQTRVQPIAGLASRYIEDPEAPWATPVVYTATVVHGGVTDVYTSPAVQLTPAAAWAVHPTTPGLSVCIDAGRADRMGIASVGAVGRASNVQRHVISGSKNPVVTKQGPRASSVLQVVVSTVTSDDENRLWALVDDQTPLLVRMPPGWGWNWEDGYYDVGDVAADRILQFGPEQRRSFTLPMTRVDSPAGDQQSQWSYAGLLATVADYPSLVAAYADYSALLANRRQS